jgi:hypothetical protein
MKTSRLYAALIMALFSVTACHKNDNPKYEATVATLSGTYGLTALTWTYGGNTYNMYDSLEICEKDNLITLNSDLTVTFIDAGTACDPPEDDNGHWYLSGDSLYIEGDAAKIKSFDGITLVLTGSPNGDPLETAITTLTKK